MDFARTFYLCLPSVVIALDDGKAKPSHGSSVLSVFPLKVNWQ